MIEQCVILAGGKGERLRPLTDSVPKPMAPVNGIPFLDYLLYSMVKSGIRRFLILVGYKSEIIVSRYTNTVGIDIQFSLGSPDEMTGDRIINAYDRLDDVFLLVYGDNYWPVELSHMWDNYQKLKVGLTTTVFSNIDGTGEYGMYNNIVVGKSGNVLKYDKLRQTKEANGVDIGYFLIRKTELENSISGPISFEEHILPIVIAKNELGAYVTNRQYYFITNYSTLNTFESATQKNNFLPLPKCYFYADSC